MKIKKKAATLGVTLALTTLMLAACGSNGNNSSGNAGATDSGSSSSPSSASATLSYMTWTYSDRTASTDAWIQDMKDKYNITIDMQNVPPDQYATLLKTKLASDDLPDLFLTHGIDNEMNTVEKFKIQPGQLVDLSGLKSVQDFIPSVIESRKANKEGKLFYLPVSTNALGVLYNKKVFADNGITIPTNIDELAASFEKLKAGGIAPMAAGFKDPWTTQIIPFIAFGQYIDAKDPTIKEKLATGELKYADIKDDMTKVLNVQLDWADKGYFTDNFLGTDASVASQLVATGKAAMMVTGTWQLSAIQSANPDAEIGFFALPLNAPGEKTALPTNANEGLLINAKTENLDAAKQAMDFYLSPENQARIMKDLNGIPTNTKVQVDNPFTKEVQQVMGQTSVIATWWGTDGLYQPSGTSFLMEKSQQNLVAKGTTPDQFIADYDAANAKVLNK
ncbi:ABC transporter substrate-binding protein [Paenibacillus solisilvae]|uniref:ABC transporter substrate-binding protein n=1 Tax=Paenibacillus solisilvae TaxID=2486751 RepID=A0ABW0VV70_9BACL